VTKVRHVAEILGRGSAQRNDSQNMLKLKKKNSWHESNDNHGSLGKTNVGNQFKY
jgi:hypothetical protein